MNNKGQSLVLFICLIPVLVAIFAFIFDTCYIVINNNKLDNIANLAINYALDNKEPKEIKQIILKNDDEIKIINITNENIHLKKELTPIFGQIIGYKNYNLEVNLNGFIENNKKVIKKG